MKTDKVQAEMDLEEAMADKSSPSNTPEGPSKEEGDWLKHGLKQSGGKLPLFDKYGQRISSDVVKACIEKGWAEPWFSNPIKPDWLVCKITNSGRKTVS